MIEEERASTITLSGKHDMVGFEKEISSRKHATSGGMIVEEKIKALTELLREEPYTPSELAGILKMHHFTVEKILATLASSRPEIRCKSIGRYKLFWIKREEPEEIADFIKHLHPEPSAKLKILIKLLKSKAINRENPTSLKTFNENELKLLDELASKQRLVITPYGSTYLTELGRKIAEGAVKLYKS